MCGFLHHTQCRRPTGRRQPERPGPLPRAHGLQRNGEISGQDHPRIPSEGRSPFRLQRKCIYIKDRDSIQHLEGSSCEEDIRGLGTLHTSRLVMRNLMRPGRSRCGKRRDQRGVEKEGRAEGTDGRAPEQHDIQRGEAHTAQCNRKS